MTTKTFTAFENDDLFSGQINLHSSFTMPSVSTLSVSVTDDDNFLSGDAYNNEQGDDHTGQHASILRDGSEIGNGGRLYIEQIWTFDGDDGNTYKLAELEQPGHLPDNFTFVGDIPPAGTILSAHSSQNVSGHGIEYSELDAGSTEPPLQNIVDIAAGSDDFNILVTALGAAGLVDAVRDADDVTVFAPTDAAFTALATDLGFDGDVSDEDAVFDFIAGALAGLAPDGDPIPLLADILLYHVSPGAKSAAEVDAAAVVDTLLTGATFGSEGTELIDNEPDVDNPNIVIPDITAANGTVQVLDKVLLPIDIPGNSPPLPTLAGIVSASGGTFDADNTDFDLLLNAVQAADLVGALDDPDADLTVFAPTDAAFIGLAQALGFEGSDEGGAFGYIVEALTLLSGGGDPIPLLQQILTYHVAPTSLDATEVLSSTSIPTLQGGSLGVNGTTLVDADPDIADPNIIATDIPALNGIAHAIDGVLLPADLLQSNGTGQVDFIIAGNANNVINTGDDDDFVDGNDGNDLIFLGSGNDAGLGGDGRDTIYGGKGDDVMRGEEGSDLMFGGAGFDRMFGGSENDLINGGGGNDLIFAQSGNDLVFAQSGNDRVFGGAGNDTVFGGAGSDAINLGAGNDKVFGGADIDTITGAGGNDILSGGGGDDIFVFAANQGDDTIIDYTGADTIDISAFGITDGGGSNQDWRDATTSVGPSGGGLNVTITWNGGGTLLLQNTTVASLTDDDFAF